MAHANDIVVGQASQFFDVTLEGTLLDHVIGIARAIRQVTGVVDTDIRMNHNLIRVSFEISAYDGDDVKQLRYRVRNRLRDYIGDATGSMPNIGEDGSYAHLVEDSPFKP